jgi:peptidyl-prolyl cis-trans isomerase SurA
MIRFGWTVKIQRLIPRGLICCRSRAGILCILFFVFSAGPVCGEEIDRLIAAVNGKVITEGDLDLVRRLNALLFQEKNTSGASLDAELRQLIDLELMRQELKSFSLTTEGDKGVESRMRALRNAYAEKGGLPALLHQAGIQESELISYLQLESSIATFVDFRFRPFVNISEEEIKKYYLERFVPQLRKSNLEVPALAQISGRIEEILKEEKINGALDQWISDIRRHGRIEYFSETLSIGNSE